jgi:predicted neuraminidase
MNAGKGLALFACMLLACGGGGGDGDVAPAPPLFETDLIIPENSIPCVDDDGNETTQCNHHGSTITVLPDGTVMAAWFTGDGEYSPDSRLVWSVRSPGPDGTWSDWKVLFDEPDVPEGNPVLHYDPVSGELWLFYVRVVGANWNFSQIMLIRSDDLGETWSEPATLRTKTGWMTRNHPIRLSDEEILLPCYDETFFVPTYLFSRDDFTEAWEEVQPPDEVFFASMGQIQPTVIERTDGSLFALLRNGNLDPVGHALEATSLDAGRTWTLPQGSAIPNPGAAMEMTRLPSGAVMAVFNNSKENRWPLSVALSDDEGETWPFVADIVDSCGGGSGCPYPSIAVDPTDGSAWISYTHGRRTIGWVHLNEAWVRAQSGTLATAD